MFTASYYSFKGAGRIGISRGTPRGVPAGFRKYVPLSPGVWLWETTDQNEYRDRYFDQLSKLDPAQVIADLHRLAGECAIPTLLCFCNLTKPGAWCHRTMVAEWVTEKVGLSIIELSPTAVRKLRKNEKLLLNL